MDERCTTCYYFSTPHPKKVCAHPLTFRILKISHGVCDKYVNYNSEPAVKKIDIYEIMRLINDI